MHVILPRCHAPLKLVIVSVVVKSSSMKEEDHMNFTSIQMLSILGVPLELRSRRKNHDENESYRIDKTLTQPYSKPRAHHVVVCCFNHIIGLPWKNNQLCHPIYLWQKGIFDVLQSHKLLAILKARGVGSSEFLLRYALLLCLKHCRVRDNHNQNLLLLVLLCYFLSTDCLFFQCFYFFFSTANSTIST
jgi:hypothetical protein